MARDSMTFEELVAYGQADHAGTHDRTESGAAAAVDAAQIDADWKAVQSDGYVIMEGLLSADVVAEVRAGVLPLLGKQGRNPFEGLKTQRVYNVLQKTRVADGIVAHPRVLALLDRLFLPNYLVSQLQVINIASGEVPQAIHYDDGFYRMPRPRPALGAATVFAIDAFTTDNGATRIIPGSHLWGPEPPGENDPAIPAVMPAGSAIFFLGTSWHGGGENRSRAPRLAVTAQYCEPWLRQQENFSLGVSKEVARTVSEDIRRLLGYSIHPPFMGMVDGMSPKQLLDEPDDA